MFNLFSRENKQPRSIRELVTSDLSVLPRNKISRLVTTDNAYYKVMPGRKVSFYCFTPSRMKQLSPRVSSYN